MDKRNLFDEIQQSIESFRDFEKGKVTLKTTALEKPDVQGMKSTDIKDLRDHLNVSRAVFARMLNTRLRTLEKWEQGITKPNDQAIVLMRLVEKYPDTINRISSL